MLASNIIFTLFFPLGYRLSAIAAGELSVSPDTVIALNVKSLKYTFVIRLVFWTCLWAAKGAFLALYWQLFKPSRSFVRVWWLVVVFTIITYFICVAGTLTACGSASSLFNLGDS